MIAFVVVVAVVGVVCGLKILEFRLGFLSGSGLCVAGSWEGAVATKAFDWRDGRLRCDLWREDGCGCSVTSGDSVNRGEN